MKTINKKIRIYIIVSIAFVILGIVESHSIAEFMQGILGYIFTSGMIILFIFIYSNYKRKRQDIRNNQIHIYKQIFEDRNKLDKLKQISKFVDSLNVIIQLKDIEFRDKKNIELIKDELNSIVPNTTAAFKLMLAEKYQSSVLLQRKLGISEREASDILSICDSLGLSFTSPRMDNIISEDEIYRLININSILDLKFIMNNGHENIVDDNCSIEKVDKLSGYEFEHFICQLLSILGYNARVTQASNDYGADVIAEKDNITYAIQCKLYSSPVSNSAVQEVNAAKSYYKTHVAVVVTNNIFTRNAIKLAEQTNVVLWNRSKLVSLINKSREYSN